MSSAGDDRSFDLAIMVCARRLVGKAGEQARQPIELRSRVQAELSRGNQISADRVEASMEKEPALTERVHHLAQKASEGDDDALRALVERALWEPFAGHRLSTLLEIETMHMERLKRLPPLPAAAEEKWLGAVLVAIQQAARSQPTSSMLPGGGWPRGPGEGVEPPPAAL